MDKHTSFIYRRTDPDNRYMNEKNPHVYINTRTRLVHTVIHIAHIKAVNYYYTEDERIECTVMIW